jgi:hypothetical protein
MAMDGSYTEIQKKTPSLGRRWMLLFRFLVEAAGIEDMHFRYSASALTY